jgi:hypothetical protein
VGGAPAKAGEKASAVPASAPAPSDAKPKPDGSA